MILRDFPDYTWLKKQAETAFKERLVVGGKPLRKEGWPLVILNTETRQCDRPHIKGPFSIFTNIHGNSMVRTGSHQVRVSEDHFYITNREQYYSLEIDSPDKVETFNLHLGQDIWEDYIYAAITSQEKLVDNPSTSTLTSAAEFPNLLLPKNKAITTALDQLHQTARLQEIKELELQELLVPLLHAISIQKQEITRQAGRIPLLRASTRYELFRRVSLATDFIRSYPEENISLEQLAGIACLSKFHFLRTFTSIHRATPHQFMLQQKIRKGQHLLRRSRIPVGEVGLLCGFTELSAFSRAFRKYTGCTPQAYRLLMN